MKSPLHCACAALMPLVLAILAGSVRGEPAASEPAPAPDKTCYLVEWALQAPLEEAGRNELCRLVKQDGEALLGGQRSRILRERGEALLAQAPADLAATRESLRYGLLDAALSTTEHLELAFWIRRLYLFGNFTRLASGKRAFTAYEARGMVDLADFAWARNAEMHPGNPLPGLAPGEERIQAITRVYEGLPEAAQKTIFAMPMRNAALRAKWPGMNEEAREKALAPIIETFKAMPGQMIAPSPAQ